MLPDAAYPPPVACERLSAMLPRFGGSLTTLTATAARKPPANTAAQAIVSNDAATEIAYPLPAYATGEVRAFLKSFSRASLTPEFIARLPGGRVFGAGGVLSPDGRTLARDVSIDLGKPFADHWLLTYAKMKPPLRLEGAVTVVAVTLGMGYGHWLLEELPRLLMVAREQPLDRVILHTQSAFAREALAIAPFPLSVIPAKRYSHFECDELIVPSLVGGEGRPTRYVAELLRTFTGPFLERLGTARSGPGERLYITRARAGRRRVVNEDALWSSLETRGFVRVELEALSWLQQVEAFAQAQVVVAPHGAGLANLVFCQPGTRVVELFNRAYVNPCYWRLAGVGGLDYRPLVAGMPDAPALPLAYDRNANKQDVFAEIGAVIAALDSA